MLYLYKRGLAAGTELQNDGELRIVFVEIHAFEHVWVVQHLHDLHLDQSGPSLSIVEWTGGALWSGYTSSLTEA